MGDFLRTILESIQFLWPFRLVEQWERGGYYVCGRWWREVGPGLKFVVPWFTHVETVSIVPAMVGTGRQDITLSDGSTLSFSAMATVRVTDVNLAINSVDQYRETVQELVGALLAEKLAEVDAERLSPGKRNRLFSDLLRWLQAEAAVFGVEISKVRFTSFVLNVPTYRLLTEGGSIASW
jgi:regulator of protease activity HflC (stomatin/prohibitin superfamily)